MLVQLRCSIDLPSADYVNEKGWEKASLERCPHHPQGGCGFARHGTYSRVHPVGTKIARWYCPKAHQTFSLLPDTLAARLSSTLEEVEAVVEQVERAGSFESAAEQLRVEIGLPGALRWLQRRVHGVHRALHVLKGMMPEPFSQCAPKLLDFRPCLGRSQVLQTLRSIGESFLPVLPSPLGFAPRLCRGGAPRSRRQHETGADFASSIG